MAVCMRNEGHSAKVSIPVREWAFSGAVLPLKAKFLALEPAKDRRDVLQ